MWNYTLYKMNGSNLFFLKIITLLYSLQVVQKCNKLNLRTMFRYGEFLSLASLILNLMYSHTIIVDSDYSVILVHL